MIEQFWSNLRQSSKVSLVKKLLKSRRNSTLSSIDFDLNGGRTSPNDENHFQTNVAPNNESKQIFPLGQKFNRTTINEIIEFLKENCSIRYFESSCSTSEVRRSSRVRRVPIKCFCSSCSINRSSRKDSSSSSTIVHGDSNEKCFQPMVEFYLKLDDQISESTLTRDQSPTKPENRLDETLFDENPMEIDFSQILDSRSTTDYSLSSILPRSSLEPENQSISSSIDFLLDSTIFGKESKPVDVTTTEPQLSQQTRRTFVILADLDEPFFGPYPIEFTISI